MRTLKLVDKDLLLERMFDSDAYWQNVDTKDLIERLPVLTVRVPDHFLTVMLNWKDES